MMSVRQGNWGSRARVCRGDRGAIGVDVSARGARLAEPVLLIAAIIVMFGNVTISETVGGMFGKPKIFGQIGLINISIWPKLFLMPVKSHSPVGSLGLRLSWIQWGSRLRPRCFTPQLRNLRRKLIGTEDWRNHWAPPDPLGKQ